MTEVIYQQYPMVEYDQFLPELLLEFPELPEEIARHYIRQSCIDTARRWRGVIREVPLDMFACVNDYQIDMECVDIVAILGVTGDAGCPTRHYDFQPPNTIIVNPAPANDASVMLQFIVSPTEDSCEVDEILFTTHKELIQHGVRYRLYQMPRKAWTDLNAAVYYRDLYDSLLSQAITDRLMNGKMGPVKMVHMFSRGKPCR